MAQSRRLEPSACFRRALERLSVSCCPNEAPVKRLGGLAQVAREREVFDLGQCCHEVLSGPQGARRAFSPTRAHPISSLLTSRPTPSLGSAEADVGLASSSSSSSRDTG